VDDPSQLRDSVFSIVRCDSLMKRIFSHPVTALAAGLCLRLFFVLKYPVNSTSDTVLYEQMATNWLQHHVYAMNVDGAILPVDLRMPGYPAFLAFIYAITGRTGPDARFYVRLGQVVVDLCACLATAWLAALLFLMKQNSGKWKRVFIVTLWLAALCPFTANYTAVPLTEVFAGFFTAAAMVALIALIWASCGGKAGWFIDLWTARHADAILALAGGLLVGIGTLFRPETPILLVVAWIVIAFMWLRKWRFRSCLKLLVLSAIGCVLPLAPWAVRNAVTLHEVQFLAPKNSNLPGELVPYGFMAWEKTWLFRLKDCYLVPWKLNGEEINLDDIPGRAFDTPEEKERTRGILEQYNQDVTLSPEEDAEFGQLARERTSRHQLRTYLWLPIARGFVMWFTPRIELLPYSGDVFPLKEAWENDPVDQRVTIGFFLLNVLYVVLAVWGAWLLWRENTALRLAVALLVMYMVLRTAFLTTLETPEPRYVLECFPAVLALAGQIFTRRVKILQPGKT
jgi:4-amino-4-deoxy-L-arabinose transferase-like glycosyltransferase